MTLPVCKSCGKSTRSHSRQEYCAPCASAQDAAKRAAKCCPHRPTPPLAHGSLNTHDYREAVSGKPDASELSREWHDKPHRLVYDLCREIDRLRAPQPSAPCASALWKFLQKFGIQK
jgi:hypothetical protein